MPTPKIEFIESSQDCHEISTDILVIGVFQEEKSNPETCSGEDIPESLNKAFQGRLYNSLKEDSFTAKLKSSIVFRKEPGDSIQARRTVLVGLGHSKKWNGKKISESILIALESVIKLDGAESITFQLPLSALHKPKIVESSIISFSDALHSALYKSLEFTGDKPESTINRAMINMKDIEPSLPHVIEEAAIMGEACSYSKDLVNMPSNLKNTMTMVNAAKSLESIEGMEVTVIDDVAWIKNNMPSFYSVARGALASDPPKFIHLKYITPGSTPVKKIALVGKSVIFDTGGYQVKPSEFMNTMKGDMTGGAQVLATMQALSKLKIQNIEFHAYLAATPNKIDSDALLPDSIIASSCGKKIEVRHTDAEGRLTLIDAVFEALKEGPEQIITIATLTGSAKRCLGDNVALLTNHAGGVSPLLDAARITGDPFQTLDVTDEDYEDIESKLDGADLINTNHSKTRGTQTAAAFVMTPTPDNVIHFHMDIAGVDVDKDEKATGFGQKAVIRYLIGLSREQ